MRRRDRWGMRTDGECQAQGGAAEPWRDPSAEAHIKIDQHVTKKFGDVAAVNEVSLDNLSGRAVLPAGRLGLGQDRRCCACSPGSRTDRRHHRDRRQDMAGVPPYGRRQHDVPVLRAVPAHDVEDKSPIGLKRDKVEGRDRPARQRAAQSRQARRLARASPTSCRAASASASPSPASARRPSCSCSMSPSAPRQEAARGDAVRAGENPGVRPASPSSSSPTTRRRR